MKIEKKIKRKNFGEFIESFGGRIKTAEKYLIKMQHIISDYGFSNNRRLSDDNKFNNFLKDTKFHELDSKLNVLFDMANDYRLNNNPYISKFNSEIERLSDVYRKIMLQIDTIDGSLYRDYINNNSSNNFIYFDDNFDDNEPSDYELMKIQNKKYRKNDKIKN